VKAASLKRFAEAALPRATDDSGCDVPFPIEVVELFESPSRRGYGPQGRQLAPIEHLTFAALELLYRDDLLGERIRKASAWRPTCSGLHPAAPTRFLVDHVTHGGHAAGACRTWMAEVVAIARVAGIPSLDAMLFQVEAARRGLRPGRVANTRLRSADAVHELRGVRRRPTRDLLARRAHQAGSLAALRAEIAACARTPLAIRRPVVPRPGRYGWPLIAQEFDQEVDLWARGQEPDRRDITHPVWREWMRRDRPDNDPVVTAERLAESVRLAKEDRGQAYRKRAASIQRLLDEHLPDLG
jgi:hypothetical protein